MLPFLGDAVDHAPAEVVPIDHALGDRLKRHAGLSERCHIDAGLEHIEPPEAILIPTKDPTEPPRGRLRDHAEECLPLLGGVARDPLVLEDGGDTVALRFAMSPQGFLLLRDRSFLLIGRHPQVERDIHGEDLLGVGVEGAAD